MKVCNDFHHLEEMVESNDCVKEHEERLGNLKDVLHLPCGPRLEVSDTVVTHIANGPSSEGREYETWDDCFSVLCQLFLEKRQWVTLRSMARTCLQDLPWIYRIKH